MMTIIITIYKCWYSDHYYNPMSPRQLALGRCLPKGLTQASELRRIGRQHGLLIASAASTSWGHLQ